MSIMRSMRSFKGLGINTRLYVLRISGERPITPNQMVIEATTPIGGVIPEIPGIEMMIFYRIER